MADKAGAAEVGSTVGTTPSGTPGASSTGAGQPSGASPQGSSASTGAQAGQAAGQPSGAAAPGEYEIKVDGKTRKVSLQELVTLAQQGDDYTRKSQSLSTQKRQLEQEHQARIDAAVAARIQEILAEGGQAGEGEDGGANPGAAVSETTARLQAIEHKMADDKLDNTLKSLKQEFPLLNERLFMLEAMEAKVNKFEDLKDLAKQHQEARESERGQIFESMLTDGKHPLVSQYRQKAIEEYLAQKAKENGATHETGATGSPGGGAAPSKPKSWDEADKIALGILEKAHS